MEYPEPGTIQRLAPRFGTKGSVWYVMDGGVVAVTRTKELKCRTCSRKSCGMCEHVQAVLKFLGTQ